MPIDANIALQVKPPPFTDPLQRVNAMREINDSNVRNEIARQDAANRNALSQLAISKAQKEQAAMEQMAAKITAAGGPDNIPEIAAGMIHAGATTGRVDLMNLGIGLQQKYMGNQVILQSAGLGGGAGTAQTNSLIGGAQTPQNTSMGGIVGSGASGSGLAGSLTPSTGGGMRTFPVVGDTSRAGPSNLPDTRVPGFAGIMSDNTDRTLSGAPTTAPGMLWQPPQNIPGVTLGITNNLAVAPTQANALAPQQQSLGQSPQAAAPVQSGGITPQIARLLVAGQPNTIEAAKMLQEFWKPISTRFGIFVRNPANPNQYIPAGGALPQGALPYTFGPNGQPDVSPYPGQVAGVAALEGAKQQFKTGVTKVTVYDQNSGDQYQIELNPTQQAEWQRTGKIPPELLQGGSATPAASGLNLTAPTDAIAKETAFQLRDQGVPSFSVGVGRSNAPKSLVVGRGQTQSEGIAQTGQKAQATSFGQERGQLEAQKPVATLAMNDSAANLDRLASLASELSNHPGLPHTTGLMGVVPNIPGTQASDAAAKLETLKSQVAFSALQAMRNASKTGGALGQVSDIEEQMLANNLAALQKAQSPEAIIDSMKTIAAWAKGAKSRMQNAYDMTYKGVEPLPPAGQAVAPSAQYGAPPPGAVRRIR